MNKDEALDLAQEALKLSSVTVDSFGVQRKIQEAITAIKQARALDKKAENARELGLDYEPVAPMQEDWGPGPHECHSLTAAPVQNIGVEQDERVFARIEARKNRDAAHKETAQRSWAGLMRGVRVEGGTVVISVKCGNKFARQLCAALIEEMNK